VLIFVVYFIYPETANVRLEDMNSLFGDPSLDIRSNRAADQAIPGLNIEPPELEGGGKAMSTKADGEGEGIGGWISNMVKRTKGDGEGDSSSTKYKRVGQDED
jgi:hypothetical protein